jgi:hypothetical protein
MEKWDVYKNPSLVSNRRDYGRHHWMVLPSTILEEELKSAHDLCREHWNKKKQLENLQGIGQDWDQGQSSAAEGRLSRPSVVPVRKIGSTDFSIYQQQQQQQQLEVQGIHGKDGLLERIVEDEVSCDDEMNVRSKATKSNNKKQLKKKNKKKIVDKIKEEMRKEQDARLVAAKKTLMEWNQRVGRKDLEQEEEEYDYDVVEEEEEEEEPLDESELDPEELLRRARSRLLEDLSAENGLDKGVMAFPHSLDKYKEVREILYAWCMLTNIASYHS